MEKSKFVILGLLIFAFWFASGCATMLNDTNETVQIFTNPKGAKIYVDDIEMGKSPITVKMSVTKDHIVKFEKEGYKTRTFNVGRKMESEWIVLDILTLIPGVILPGALLALIFGDYFTGPNEYFNEEAACFGLLLGGLITMIPSLLKDDKNGSWFELDVENGEIKIDLEPLKKNIMQ